MQRALPTRGHEPSRAALLSGDVRELSGNARCVHVTHSVTSEAPTPHTYGTSAARARREHAMVSRGSTSATRIGIGPLPVNYHVGILDNSSWSTRGPNADLTIGLTTRSGVTSRWKRPANEAVQRTSSPRVVVSDSACHAGGRGFESRRSRKQSLQIRMFRHRACLKCRCLGQQTSPTHRASSP